MAPLVCLCLFAVTSPSPAAFVRGRGFVIPFVCLYGRGEMLLLGVDQSLDVSMKRMSLLDILPRISELLVV